MAESTLPRGAVVGPFSGPRAAWGEHLERAAELYGAVSWELYDDRGEATTARQIAEAVVAEGRHALVIGHFNSAGARAALPVYRAAGLPVLLPLATTPGLLDDSAGTILRWCPDDRAQAVDLLAAVRAAGHTRVAVTHDGSAYGKHLAHLVRAARHPREERSPVLPSGPVVSDGSTPATGAVPVPAALAPVPGSRSASASASVPVRASEPVRESVPAAPAAVSASAPGHEAVGAGTVDGGSRELVDRARPQLLDGPGPEPVDRPGAGAAGEFTAVVVCGTHVGAARVGREWRAAGFSGAFYFTDDCAVDEFAALLAEPAAPAASTGAAGGAHVARMRGGPEAQVTAAFEAATAALAEDPNRRGRSLLAAVRAHADRGFTALGEPVPGSVGWDLVPVPPAPAPASAPASSSRAHEPHGTSHGTSHGRAYDVIVVGAGVVGAATASVLARRGARVALVAPMDGGTDHATAWSGGLVRSFEADPYLRGLALRSHRLAWGPAALIPGPYGFVATGSLVLCGDADLEQAEKGVAELNGAGVPAELLEPDALSDRFPGLSVAGVTAAVWEPEAGYADPPRTARVYRDRALANGARLLPARVRELVAPPGADRVRVLLEPGGPVEAHAVVLAAGSGTGEIAGHRLSGSDAGRTKSIRYGFFHHPDTAGLPTVVDMVTGVWGRPQLSGEAAGGYMAGRPVDEWDVPPGGEDSLTDEHVAYIREGAAVRWPWLADPATRFLGGRRGVDLYTPHSRPHLGRERAGSRIVLATGWSGAGFKTAPAAAELAAAEALDVLAGS
ncbi:FAD-dependent oxidoreductase [Streptomyces sp. ISL-36]|uniref:FAD-dependent oxidoreductase n=1 Tax=Streptomyces sp. ISL-36 TaxID=2819182 RepID=UPI001BE53CB8|nr:FAD-dependent oxidoreductase [Streptomyces sp. ISL-36]MBT2441029.1 FAD-dependent oxidoreductase [Streptomyces sp. ISL-36]